MGRASSPILVGRDAELNALDQAVARAAEDPRRVIVVEGEAGIGKTRLLDEFTRKLTRDLGADTIRIVFGRCTQLTEGALPYGPIVDMLDELAARLTPKVGRQAARLRDELTGSIEADDATSAGSRGRLFLEVRRTLATIAADRPLILAIDDLHWADRSTLDLIAYLSTRLTGTPVTLLLAYRTDELDRRHPLRPLLAELQRDRLLARITLGPLTPPAVTVQMEAIQGDRLDPSFARRVIDLADGNPFHVEELVALGGPWSSLPVSLRDVSLTRVERLGPDAQTTVRQAAVIGREFDENLLAALTGRSDPRGGIRSAVDAFVLVPTDDGRHYRFRHALLWEAVYEDILPAERIAIHRRVAEALVTDPDLTSTPGAGAAAEIARHYDLGQQFDLARTAYVLAGDLALRARAWAEAAAAFERVLQIDTLQATPSDAADLSLADRAMKALWYSGRPRQGEELLRTALERAGTDHDPLELAASWMRLANLLNDVGDDPASRVAAARARAIAPRRPPNDVRLYAMGALASSYMVDDRNRRAVRLAGCVIAMADELGARHVMAEARAQRGPSLLALGRVIEAERDFEIARRLAADADDPYGLSIVLYNFGANFRFVGAFEEGLERVLEASAIAVDLGLERSWEPWLRPSAAEFCFWLGRWDEADRHLASARTYEIHGLPLGMAAYVEAALAAHRGDGGRADAALAEAAGAIASGIALQGLSRAVRARAQLIAGDAPAALVTVDEGIAFLASTDDLAARAHLASLGAEAAADLAERQAARRDPVAARELADRAHGYARFAAEIADGRLVPGSVATPLTRAHAAHAHADALRAAGKAEVDAWTVAVAAFERMGARPMVALTRFRLAEAALVAGDRTAARDALVGARSIAHETGDRWLGSAIAGLARRGRLDLNEDPAKGVADAVPSAPLAGDPWDLSARESEVLALVAEGLTNREIARRLFITEKTASSHVTHILDKLGVTSRTEAALVAVKAGGLATSSWSDAPVRPPSAAQPPHDQTRG